MIMEQLLTFIVAAYSSLVAPAAPTSVPVRAAVHAKPAHRVSAASGATASGATASAPAASKNAAKPNAPAAANKPAATPGKPLPVASTAAPAAADVAIEKVQAFYASVQQVTAKFRQSVSNATFGSTKDSDGKVWIRKPGKMRWDYYAKKKGATAAVKKSFISNATNLYVVDHDNKQVIKKNLQRDLLPVAVSFLYGQGDLRADFNAEIDSSGKYGTPGEIVLRLTPKRPSAQYKNLVLVVAPDNHRVTQSIIIDSENNVNHFRFFEPDFEKAQKDAWFEFDEKSVKDYRVTDADQEAKPEGGKAEGTKPASGAAAGAPASSKTK